MYFIIKNIAVDHFMFPEIVLCKFKIFGLETINGCLIKVKTIQVLTSKCHKSFKKYKRDEGFLIQHYNNRICLVYKVQTCCFTVRSTYLLTITPLHKTL